MSESHQDLIELALSELANAQKGDAAAAKRVLANCAIALRGLIERNEVPDPERTVSLGFLLTGLEAIQEGVDARKALGLFVGNRPALGDPLARDFNLFYAVGSELERLKSLAADAGGVRAAQGNVARKFRLGPKGADTVRKSWERLGGLRGWRSLKSEWEKS